MSRFPTEPTNYGIHKGESVEPRVLPRGFYDLYNHHNEFQCHVKDYYKQKDDEWSADGDPRYLENTLWCYELNKKWKKSRLANVITRLAVILARLASR